MSSSRTDRSVRRVRTSVRIGIALSFPVLLLPMIASAADVHPRVFQQAVAQGSSDVVFVFGDQAQPLLAPLSEMADYRTRRRALVDALRARADHDQRDLRVWLDRQGIAHRDFWIANVIQARVPASAVDPLAARSDVARIDPNPAIALRFPARTPRSVMPEAIASLPWGVSKIQAPAVWSAGFRGAGVVVANEDTGVQWDHPALKAQYRGWNGSSVDHDYNWHDAVADTACRAGGVSAPCDPNSHGTHTTGTMAGDDGADHPIGVAPGARWIHCRNMDASGTGTTASYIECLQWLLAPTDLSGANPNPDLAPDVVNNSWYCAVSEGCTSGNELAVAVNNLVAGGIFFAAAAGNSGSDCQTIAGPPAIYDAAFVVGATDATETLASFSSRGPVGGSALIRPDVSAPGVNISSSVPGSGYDIKQGTSMATPHVAGAAALLMSAFPALKGRPAEVVAILRATAVHDVLDGVPGQNCGSTPITTWPNFMAGYGRVDAWNAYHELIFIDGLDD